MYYSSTKKIFTIYWYILYIRLIWNCFYLKKTQASKQEILGYFYYENGDKITVPNRKKIVYDVVEYISKIHRPIVKSPDESGRMRLLES